ncbi:MAG: hypothetical protein E7407_05635 [Ruminococcaceae bacterium]|nr:hypothetical protein [Oscillospiraceae bacterium]
MTEENALRFYDVRKEPFKIYGLYKPETEPVFRRMPRQIAEAVSESLVQLNDNTAGGRIRFSTDSRHIAIKAVVSAEKSSNMSVGGTCGFDLYEDIDCKSSYVHTFLPIWDFEKAFRTVISFPDAKKRSFTLYFPLYCCVESLYVGLEEGAGVWQGEEYHYKTPVLYYGSSITQGGCASRPGNCYQALISRRLNCDYINLGFSGNAKAEDVIVDYMAGLNYSIFVLDYDHNAPTIEHLENTHCRAYKKIRAKRADAPIIFISRPNFDYKNEDDIRRRETVYSTYQFASRNGDKNVYFIDGESLFGGEDRDCCTVDGVHPNDLGFYRMADIIGAVVGRLLSQL